MSLLELDDVKVQFGGVRAVDGVSLVIEEGGIYGVVGPNGSGKTTLINAISRVGPITSGHMKFDGVEIERRRSFEVGRLGLARTFQGIKLVQSLTVLQNVMLGADFRVLDPNKGEVVTRRRWGRRAQRLIRARAYEALERVGMADFADEHPQNLSYGSQRRIEIGRAIAGSPQLLLLDEPVAGMNRKERGEIAELLRSLRDGGVTQLLVEHDLRIVLDLSDHLFVVNFGRMIAEGDPETTAARPEVVEAYLGHHA